MILPRNAARPRSRAAAIDQPTLLQFVVLSMLLHLLLVVLFGNPSGGARRDDGWLGPLDVRLGRPAPEPTPEFRPEPGLQTGAPGPSLLPRSGAASPYQSGSPRRATEPSAAPAPPVDALPRLNPNAPEEVDKPLPLPAPAPATIEPLAPPARPREWAAPVELPPRVVPTPAPALPLEKSIAPRSEPQLAPPVELPPRAQPAVPESPLLERSAPPPQPELAPGPALPTRALPELTAAPLERLSPAPVEREVAPPVELPPRAVPVAPEQPLERLQPAPLERTVPPAQLPAPQAERPLPPSAPTAQPQPPATPAPMPQRLGPPDATEDIFKPRRDGGAGPAERPRIDLDAARKKAAREIVDEGAGSRGVFTVPAPPTIEPKSKAAAALEKAIKPDCRTAYANMGLLAAPVLIASAIAADPSCRW